MGARAADPGVAAGAAPGDATPRTLDPSMMTQRPAVIPASARPSAEVVDHLFTGLREYAIFALGSEADVTSWSAGSAALTGLSAEEVVGRPFASLFAPDSTALADALVAEAARSASAVLEARMSRKDGTSFAAAGVVSAVRGAEGPGGYLVIARDMTVRRRAEEALRVAEATYQGILAISADAVVCVSEDQRVTFFNQGAEATFGYRADEVIGQPLEVLIPEYIRDRHRRLVQDFAGSGIPARRMGERGEISGRRKDGSIFPAEASISRLDVGGTRVFTAVLRDVSERRRAEEALSAHARELARSNDDLQQFAYVASHDLQEPLRMVASYTQLLARRYRGALDADADEFIAFAVDGVTRMQALINDLLAYSRVGSRESERAPVSLEEVLGRVLHTLSPATQTEGATVTHDPLPTVQGDAGQLAQLFQNLIGNAIKFRGADPPRVHVSARHEDGGWVVSVRDNGIGIAPEFATRIFAIFQRLHSRTEYPGTGIGLAICRKIVERHGGRIWVESEPGHGSTFNFTLPDRSAASA
jgi:PAS domain S-box-containing protein